MSATPVDSFVSTCEANDVPCTHATPEEFREVLAPMLDQPAVGVALRDGAGERVASGTSCLEQLAHLLDRPAAHPVELLVPGDGRGL